MITTTLGIWESLRKYLGIQECVNEWERKKGGKEKTGKVKSEDLDSSFQMCHRLVEFGHVILRAHFYFN